MDERSFDELKRITKRISNTKKGLLFPMYSSNCPLEVTIQLTNQCNLRCKHCFQWNQTGYHRNCDINELNLNVLKDILYDDKLSKSVLYLWGGEPLCYSQWDAISEILSQRKSKVKLSTNGLLIKEKISQLLKNSEFVEIIISIDGLKQEHDIVRGEGTFNKLIENINYLVELKKQGKYKGLIILNTTLNDELIPNLFEFVEYCDALGCDRLILGFPWYLPEKMQICMDEYFKNNFSFIQDIRNNRPSWHSFGYKISSYLLDDLKRQINLVNSSKWRIRIGYHPTSSIKHIESTINAVKESYNDIQHCSALSSRISIFADGNVSMCANFPEFRIGNLYKQKLLDIWHGEMFNKVRQIRNTTPMSPMICQRCRLLSFNPQ